MSNYLDKMRCVRRKGDLVVGSGGKDRRKSVVSIQSKLSQPDLGNQNE